MGYLIFMVIGLLLLVAFIIGTARQKRSKSGRISSEGTAILREEPSADEPTPARSVTASPSTAERAQKRTPPA
jgi:hypothetical protein